MASLLRRHTSGGPEDGALARNMKADLLRAMLPKQLRAHTGGPDDQGEELSDSFAYKISDADRLAVEQKRFDLVVALSSRLRRRSFFRFRLTSRLAAAVWCR